MTTRHCSVQRRHTVHDSDTDAEVVIGDYEDDLVFMRFQMDEGDGADSIVEKDGTVVLNRNYLRSVCLAGLAFLEVKQTYENHDD